MKKLEYFNEATFDSEYIEFEDKHVDLTKEIHEAFGNSGPIIVKKNKSLCFGINLSTDRVEREIGTHLYKVTIEKVNKD